MIHAAIYLRQSLDRDEGIDRQRERASALVRARGWHLVDEFVDNETRASKPRGPETAWGRMLPRIGQDFKVIVAVDLDRLLRSTQDLNVLIEHGAQVVTVDGEIDLTSADGEFRATMLAGIARFETRRASERIKRQKAQRAANGEWHGGIAPYGYRSDNKTLVVVPAEVALIEEAAKRILAGDSLHSIVTDWNKKDKDGLPGYKTRFGSFWRQTNLRSILRNETMLGKTKAGVAGNWPPIIDQRTFDRLARVFDDPARKVTHSPGVKSAKYSMGGGVTVCAVCGHRLISGGHHGKPALKCTSVVNGPTACGGVLIDHTRLERYVFEQVVASLEKNDRLTSRLSERPDDDAKITALEADRDSIREQQRALHDMRLEGTLDPDYHRSKVADLQASLDAAQAKIDDLLGRPLLSEAMKGGLDWESWSADKRRNFLKVARIRVEVGKWPDDVPRNFYKRGSETNEEWLARQDALYTEAVAKRTTITVTA